MEKEERDNRNKASPSLNPPLLDNNPGWEHFLPAKCGNDGVEKNLSLRLSPLTGCGFWRSGVHSISACQLRIGTSCRATFKYSWRRKILKGAAVCK